MCYGVHEEKKIDTLEQEKGNIVEMVNKQQELITRCMHRIEQMEAKEKYMEELAAEEFQTLENPNKMEVNDAYVEPVDYGGSQESVKSFGTKVGVTKKEGINRNRREMGHPKEVIETWIKKLLGLKIWLRRELLNKTIMVIPKPFLQKILYITCLI